MLEKLQDIIDVHQLIKHENCWHVETNNCLSVEQLSQLISSSLKLRTIYEENGTLWIKFAA
jgi:hypothetical protein